jgi:putative tryptophan/tyrosine transport system substrate-binding protein
MFAIPPLSGAKQTSSQPTENDATDPERADTPSGTADDKVLVFNSHRRGPLRGTHATTGVYRGRGGDHLAARRPCAAIQRDAAHRRVAALAPDDVETVARSAAFEQALATLGWRKGGTIAIDYHWIANDPVLAQKTTVEVVALAPDVLLASSNVVIGPLSKATGTIPIVMVQVIDPVGSGYVESMARPGANITGFTQFEYSLAGKWLDLLMEIAPRTARIAVLREPTRGPGIGQFAVIQAMAPVEPIPIDPFDVADMERRIAAFASVPNGGMIATVGGIATHRAAIIAAANKNHLPAILSLSILRR